MDLSKREKGEAQQCANTNWAPMSETVCKETNMNIVAKSDYNFQGIDLMPALVNDGIWLTSSDIAKALGYASSKSVSTIYSRNSDEFTSSMSMVIKMKTNGINNNLREKSVRVFSLRGCHLIAMFATTAKAKEFRRWVLDILDREIEHSPITKQFTDDELCQLAWLWRAGAVMITACRGIYPLLRVAEHREAGHFYSIGQEYNRTLNNAREVIKRETSHIEFQPWRDDNWSRVLPHLRQDMLQ
jgi:prophage antirepressor-like protein